MKLKLNHIMLLAPSMLLMMGCMQKEEEFQPQNRTLTAVLELGAETRTSFDADGKFSWNTGDKIAVFVGSDYVRNIVVEPSTGRISVNGSRSRYAVYPSDAADSGNSGDPTLNVILPTGYDISDIVPRTAAGSDPYIPMSDYSPMPMVAENNPLEDVLFFRHVGGLLRFKWINLPAGTKAVTVAFDKNVTGTYAVDVVDITKPTIKTADTAPATPTDNVVTFKVSDRGLASAQTVVFNVPVPVGHYGSVTINAYDAAPAGSGNDLLPPAVAPTNTLTYVDGTDVALEFDRHWGRMLASDGSFNYVIEGLEDVTVDYTGGSSELAKNFVSYKTDGKDLFPIPYVLEYSADGVSGWTTTAPGWLEPEGDFRGSTQGTYLHVNISEQQNQAADPHADYLRSLGIQAPYDDPNHPFNLSTVNVATGETVSATSANCYVVQAPGYYMFPLVYGNTLKNGDLLQYAYNSLSETTTDYAASSGRTWRFDDQCVYSSQHSSSDYVPPVPSFGTEWSVEKYWSRYKTSTVNPHSFWYLSYFRDHQDKPIVIGRPDRINNVGNSTDFGSMAYWFNNRFPGKTLTAKIIWTDSEDLVQNARVDATNTYLMFDVPADKICQGNAMIALLVDGVIAWSWHIWVTDEDLTARKQGSNSYEFAPVNIGWCDTKEIEKHEERKIYLRARQVISGTFDESANCSRAVLITSQAGPYVKIGGHSPYFQWGRKDPLPAAYLMTTENKDGVTVAPVEKSYIYHPDYVSIPKDAMGEWVSLGEAIQHPYLRYFYNGPDPHGWNWNTSWIINLWNSLIKGYGEDHSNTIVLKTIYDPSPVGYTVPPRASYNTFDDSNFLVNYVDGDFGRTYNGNLFFPSSGYYAGSGKFLYDYALYWSATMESICLDYREAYSLAYTSDYPYVYKSSGTHFGLPVRPVKDIAAF